MRLVIVLIGAALAVSCVAGLVVPEQQQHNYDLFQMLNTVVCTAGSEHCVKFGEEEVGFEKMKESLILGTLGFVHEMMHSSSVKNTYVRSQLPKELQAAIDLAKKIHQPGSTGTGVSAHKASARAFVDAVAQLRGWSADAKKYAIFSWIPQPAGSVHMGGEGNFSTSCLGNVNVKVSQKDAGKVTVTTTPDHGAFFCSDLIMMGDGAGRTLQILDNADVKTWTFDTSAYTAASSWYLNSHGVNIMRFSSGLLDTIGQIVATVEMMAGFGEMPLTNTTLAQNLDFIHNYVQHDSTMTPVSGVRTAGNIAKDLEPHIQSGDSFIILRMDGLDPMISWGEFFMPGGHSVIAMRDEDTNKLSICESNTRSTYWQIGVHGNGIECHPYDEWLVAAEKAQFNILLAPLSASSRALFNVSKAWEFFRTHKGVNYGYVNFIFGWIDTPGLKGSQATNFPCVPGPTGDFSVCLQPESAETLAMLLDKISGNNNQNIFRQGIAHRVGKPLTTPVLDSLMYAAQTLKKNFSDLYVMPEENDWLYNMTCNPSDNGPESICHGKSTVMSVSSVCDVFVTRMLRAGGVFSTINDQINSPDQTLWDLYSMKIWDDDRLGDKRPDICKTTDPECPLCQLMGSLTFPKGPAPRGAFTSFNSRPLHPWMGQSSEYCGAPPQTGIRDPRC